MVQGHVALFPLSDMKLKYISKPNEKLLSVDQKIYAIPKRHLICLCLQREPLSVPFVKFNTIIHKIHLSFLAKKLSREWSTYSVLSKYLPV